MTCDELRLMKPILLKCILESKCSESLAKFLIDNWTKCFMRYRCFTSTSFAPHLFLLGLLKLNLGLLLDQLKLA